MNSRSFLSLTTIIGLLMPSFFYAMEQRERQEQSKEPYKFTCSKALVASGSITALDIGTGTTGGLLIAPLSTLPDSDQATLSLCDIDNNRWKKILQGSITLTGSIVYDGAVFFDIKNERYKQCSLQYDPATNSVNKIPDQYLIGVGKILVTIQTYYEPPNDVEFSIRLRNMQTGEIITELRDNLHGTRRLSFAEMHDETFLIIADGYNNFTKYEIKRGENIITTIPKVGKHGYPTRSPLYENKQHKPMIIEMTADADGETLAPHGRDATTGKIMWLLPPKTQVHSMSLATIDGQNLLALGTRNGYIELWDLDTDKPTKIQMFKAQDTDCANVILHDNAGFPQIISANKGIIKIWDCIQQKEFLQKAEEDLHKHTPLASTLITTVMAYLGSNKALQQKISPSEVSDEEEIKELAAHSTAIEINHPTVHEGALLEAAEHAQTPVMHINTQNDPREQAIEYRPSLHEQRKNSLILKIAVGALIGAGLGILLWKYRKGH